MKSGDSREGAPPVAPRELLIVDDEGVAIMVGPAPRVDPDHWSESWEHWDEEEEEEE